MKEPCHFACLLQFLKKTLRSKRKNIHFSRLLRSTYIKYAESRGWKTELTSADENGIGGFKDATLLINGAGAYSRMKYESGTHR